MNKIALRLPAMIICIFIFLVLAGCASMGTNNDPRDPFENFNRAAFNFNQSMDNSVFHPVGRFYQAITPGFIDRGITNMFSNINDIVVIVNDFLQFKIEQAVSDITRFIFNSTLGLAGFFDISTTLGLPKHHEDFGQTLARWGFASGPYLILPFLGPSTVRDAAGYGVDSAVLSPIAYVPEPAHQAGLLTMNYIDFKTDLLATGNLISEAALDEYEFTKSAYFSRRENLIHDRDPASGGFEDFEEFEDFEDFDTMETATSPE